MGELCGCFHPLVEDCSKAPSLSITACLAGSSTTPEEWVFSHSEKLLSLKKTGSRALKIRIRTRNMI